MATAPFDLFELLRQDHQRVSQVMQNIEQSSQAERENLVLLLSDELGEHMTLEEDFLYDGVEDFEELRDAIRQSFGEHEQMRTLLEEVMDLDTGTPEWQAAYAGLRELKEDHVAMEEQEVFPMVARIVPEEELLRLSEQMSRQRKRFIYQELPKRAPAQKPPRAGI